MQRDRTIEFWNKFYLHYSTDNKYTNKTKSDRNNDNDNDDDGSCDNDNTIDNNDATSLNTSRPQHQQNQNCKEWILEPSAELFDILLERILPNNDFSNEIEVDEGSSVPTRPYRILEIGCGNSRFAIELWKYLVQLQITDNAAVESKDRKDNNRTVRKRKVPKCIQFVATDVSPVCIEQIQQRDSDEIQELSKVYCSSGTKNINTDDDHFANYQQYFQYSILNVVEPDVLFTRNQQFDIILDKGCLDTFLFRSRSRSSTNGTGGGAYTELIQSVLNNVHSWLYRPSALDSDIPNTKATDNVDQPGKYIILSPRSKHKSVRDYNGFSKVERFELDTTSIQLGALEGKRAMDKSTNEMYKKKKNKSTPDDGVFMYICHKDVNYDSTIINNDDDNITDNTGIEKQSTSTKAYSIETTVPDDKDTCPTCSISFFVFRNGENLAGRGKHYWCRSWKGHCLHCKRNK